MGLSLKVWKEEHQMPELTTNPWGPVDLEQVRLLARVPVAKRLRTMLEAQALAMSIVRGRLRRQHPNLPQRELNLLVIQETYSHD